MAFSTTRTLALLIAMVLVTRAAPGQTNVNGDEFRFPGPADAKAVVLIFVGNDCPISNGYAPEIGRLCRDFAAKGVTFVLVYADHDLEEKDARTHAKEFAFPCPALIDPEQTLARKFGAKVKPEAFVLSPKGDILYRGRIDDLYADLGKRRTQPTRRDLREALTAVLAGTPVATPRTDAVGCPIYYPK